MRYRTNYELLSSFQRVSEKIHDGMFLSNFHFVGSRKYNRLFFLRKAFREIILLKMDS